ncbi:metallophosphoesterase family protein [Belnapia rosea]|uniref:metallophosphoesterase family protein n=1 Tax=Belnapia rosea TaxID=938405 RepID=UPI00088F36CE|nr:metallophosphoesterase [Belnapia rosea]SDB73551.1 Calcineurin-like phosphoesterase [Belnapia rosea]
MITILQISDAHLSPRTGLFRETLARLRAWAEAERPDLLIASGDLSLDGADHEEDLAFAAGLLRDFPAPLLAIPGNHDVGSHARTMPAQPVDATRLERFRRVVGPDWWLRDLPGWRIIGLDTEIMGTGLPEEAAQAGFIAEAAVAGGRRIALFLHKPVFVTAPEDQTFDYWSVPPHARAALAPLLDHPGLRLVASGHLHLHHGFQHGAVRYAWAPPASFVVNPPLQAGLPGERDTGALVHRLLEDRVDTALVSPEGIERHWLEDIRAETYPA